MSLFLDRVTWIWHWNLPSTKEYMVHDVEKPDFVGVSVKDMNFNYENI
jgi:hypothetical protein